LIHENFVAAILDNVPLIAPGIEGIHSVELANAMIMSGIEKRMVDIPTDRAAYDKLLRRLIEEAKKK
jgi:hypothetical protein